MGRVGVRGASENWPAARPALESRGRPAYSLVTPKGAPEPQGSRAPDGVTGPERFSTLAHARRNGHSGPALFRQTEPSVGARGTAAERRPRPPRLTPTMPPAGATAPPHVQTTCRPPGRCALTRISRQPAV